MHGLGLAHVLAVIVDSVLAELLTLHVQLLTARHAAFVVRNA